MDIDKYFDYNNSQSPSVNNNNNSLTTLRPFTSKNYEMPPRKVIISSRPQMKEDRNNNNMDSVNGDFKNGDDVHMKEEDDLDNEDLYEDLDGLSGEVEDDDDLVSTYSEGGKSNISHNRDNFC